MFRIIGITLSLIFSSNSLVAQETTYESVRSVLLRKEAENELPDSLLLEGANLLRSYYADSQYDSLWILCDAMEARGVAQNNPVWIANAWHGKGKYFNRLNQYDSAFISYRYAIDLTSAQESEEIVSRLYAALGLLHASQGQLESGLPLLEKSVELAERYGHYLFIGPVYGNLAATYHLKGQYIKELEMLDQVRLHGHPNQQFRAALQTARLFLMLDLPEESQKILQKALSMEPRTNRLSYSVGINALRIELASTLHEAHPFLNETLKLQDSLQVSAQFLPLYTSASLLYLRHEMLDSALYFAALGANLEKNKSIKAGLEATPLLAEIHYRLGDYSASLALCRSLQPWIEQEDAFDQQRTLYQLLSQNFEALNQPDSALYYVRKKEAVEDFFDQNSLAKASMSTYLKLKSAEERDALQASKELAERETLMAQTQTRLYQWIFGLLGAFFALLALASYLFSRHKSRVAKQLSQLNQAFSDEQLKLQSYNQKLRRFSSIVSHDILSSLDFVLTAGNVLVKPQASKEQLAQYANLTKQSSRQLKEYCLGLLREARGEHSSDQDLTDPMPILQQVLTNFELPLQEAGVQVHLRPLSPARLPAPVVEQLFLNLVSNVVRYGASAQQPTLRIWEERFSNGTRLWVIEDNGSGIFEPLRRDLLRDEAKQVSSSKGQGLGLSLLRESLQNYKASLLIGNNQAGGTRITIVLPEQAEKPLAQSA